MLKHRYVYIFVIFAVLCLSIGAAFADEDAPYGLADSNSIDDECLEPSDDGILMDDEDDWDDEDEEDEDGPGNWADLNGVIANDDSDTITLENDYRYNSEDEDEDEFRSGIPIEKDIIIDGDGHSLNGDGMARAFNIGSENQVTLRNIVFESCFGDEGGAIYNSGTLIIENCVFRYNGYNWHEDCKTSDGGAIYNNGDLVVTNSIFYQNEAVKGGAIYNVGDLNVTLSAFLENHVVYNGEDGDGDSDDEYSYGTFVSKDEIITDSYNEDYDEDAIVAKIILPSETDGSFSGFVNHKELFDINFFESESNLDYDEEGKVICFVYLKDLNLDYLSDGAKVEFSFFVDGRKLEGFTKFAIVHMTDSTIQFSDEDDDGDGNDEDDVGDGGEDTSNGRDVYIASGTANISNSYMSRYDWDDKYVVYVEDGVEEGNVILDDNYWSGEVFKREYDEEADEEFEVLVVSNVELGNYLQLKLEADTEDDPLNIGNMYQFNVFFVRNETDAQIDVLPESSIRFYVEYLDGHEEDLEDGTVPLENGFATVEYVVEEGQHSMHCEIILSDECRINGNVEYFFGQTCKNWDDLNEDISEDPLIELNETYRFDWGETNVIELSTDGQVIEGNFNTLNGVGDASAFRITASNVLIQNLNFNKCRSAIILDGGSVTLINCTFDSCEGIWDDEEECNLRGSALRINSGTANLINCTIKNCRESAIFNGGTLNVSNSVFLNWGNEFDGINVLIGEGAQSTIINNSCLFVKENWNNRMNVYFENDESEYDLNNNFWGVEKPSEDNFCVNAEVESYIYAKLETPNPDFMNVETTFTLKFYNSDGVQLTDFFNGEVQFIESYNYRDYEGNHEKLGDPVAIIDGTAQYTYVPTNDKIQFIGAEIIYDGEVVGIAKCGLGRDDFTALIELIESIPDNGVLNLTKGYYYGGTNSRDGEMRSFFIDKNIIINGNGFVISAEDSDSYQNYEVGCQGFIIAEGCTVIINDLNINVGNSITDKGSTFYNQGDLTLNNCNVTGVIYVVEEFEDQVIYGGAIYNDEGAVMTINSSNIVGGAWGRDHYPDDLTAYGGAIYNKGSLTITESDIRGREYGDEDHDNTPTYGGGIYNEGDLNVTYSILCHNSAKIGNDIYHNGTSLYVSNSFLASCEGDARRRTLFDFIASYGEYNLYAEKTDDCILNNIWWGTNNPDENTCNLDLNNHVIFDLTAENEIVAGADNVFTVEFKNNETGESVFPCPHGTIMYFFIEKFSGKTVYVANATLDDEGKCSIVYAPQSGDYMLSAGLANEAGVYSRFDISDIRRELPIGLGGFTFTDLHDQIANGGDLLELTADYRFESDKDSLYSRGVLIENRNVIIEGNGHTINCVGLSGPLNITGGNVTIRNIHFVNSLHPIHVSGSTNLTLINCDNGYANDFTGCEIDIGRGAYANIYECALSYVNNHGSVNIDSSYIGQIECSDGSSIIVHNSILRAYGDLPTLTLNGNVNYDLNGNYWDGDAIGSLGVDIDNYLEMQIFSSFAPNVDVLNYFTVQLVYNGTNEVNTNVNFPIAFQKQFMDEIDGHPHTELIANSNIKDGVARLTYTPDINTRSINVIWGVIEDTGTLYFDTFHEFEIIPNETRINVNQDDDNIYINVTSNDILVDSGFLEVTIYVIPGEEDNGQNGNNPLGMSFSYVVGEDEEDTESLFYLLEDISEIENHILTLSKANIAAYLGIDSFGGSKWIIIVKFHSNDKNYADSEYSTDFDNETKFYTIIAHVDNHIGNRAVITVNVVSNGNLMSSGQVKLTKDDEVIDVKDLTESGVSFTLDNMEPGPYNRENGNYAIVFEHDSGETVSHTIDFVVTAKTTITTIISNDIGSVEITINLGNATQGQITLKRNGEDVGFSELNGRNSVLFALSDLIVGALSTDDYLIDFLPYNYKEASAKKTSYALKSNNDVGGLIIISDLPIDDVSSIVISLDDGRNISGNPSEGVTIPDLPPGDHRLKVSYGDGENTFDMDVDYTVKESIASSISASTVVGSSLLKVNGLPSDASGILQAVINGVTYNGTVKGIYIPPFSSSGVVNGRIIYSGDGKYNSFARDVNIAVSKISVKITAKAVTIYASPNCGYLKFNLVDSSGRGLAKTVKIVFNGKTYTVKTNAKGYGSLKISASKAKSYTASLKFAGDSVYSAKSISTKVTVKKNKIQIIAKTKKVKKSSKKVSIKYLFKTTTGKKLAVKGLTVFLNINKKTVKAKTNSKGIATFKVKLPLQKKTYKVKVTFKGTAANYKKTFSTKLKVY